MSTLFYVSYGALWLMVVVQAVLLLLVYRHFGLAAMGTFEGVQRDGIPIGELAPAFSGVTSDGADIRWESRLGEPELVLFASPDCRPCATILPHLELLAGDAKRAGKRLTVTTVVAGPREVATQLRDKFALTFPCIADDGSGVFDIFRVRVTPLV